MNFKIADSKFKELLVPTLLIVMALNISAVVDSFFLGTYLGPNAVAAIDLLEPIVILLTVFEWLFGLGGQILALNQKSEFDIDGSNKYFTVSMALTFIASMILAIICLIFMDEIATFLGSSAATKPFVMQYSTFLYGSFVLTTIAGVITQYIRVDGLPNFASVVIIVANVVNIFFDYLFLGYFKMGMSTASLATFIGYTIGLIICIYYIRNPKRTFRFVSSALEIKTFLKSSWEMIKIGFPGASTGLFNVIFMYTLNQFLIATMGDSGLTVFMLCIDSLVIASIVDVGISETLTSIVPIYYTKHDFVNLNHLIRTALMISLISASALIAFFWIWPEGFLALYNFNQTNVADLATTALRLYSLSFIFAILPNMLIFYYEAIERSVLSTIVSILFMLILPLISIFALYNIMGPNGIWLGFSVAYIITTIITAICVKLIQKRDSRYSGLFFIEKDMIDKTKNFVLTGNDMDERRACLEHLKSLNAADEFCENLDKLFNVIFDTNDPGTYVEILIIDYDENIHVDIKYDGEKENLEEVKKNFREDTFKYAEVLGFNNIECVMDKKIN